MWRVPLTPDPSPLTCGRPKLHHDLVDHVATRAELMCFTVGPATNLSKNGTTFYDDNAVWKDAPVLIGSTKFEPLPDVKNIMITGGAGFM